MHTCVPFSARTPANERGHCCSVPAAGCDCGQISGTDAVAVASGGLKDDSESA